MKLQAVHVELLRGAIRGPLTEQDALLWMALLHIYQISLKGAAIEDAPQLRRLPAATPRDAADMVAALWPDRDDQRARYGYWYRRYQLETPYEAAGQLPAEHAQRVRTFRDSLLEDPRIEAVTEEEM